MDSLFSFERLILLLIPLLFIFGGIYAWITALRGRIGKGENPLKKQMSFHCKHTHLHEYIFCYQSMEVNEHGS